MNTQLTASSLFTDLQSRIGKRQAKVGIIGLGYVGLPLALLYSEQKFAVTGFDIDQRKIDTLDNGGTYIFRITPAEIAAAKANGFKATADYSQITAMDAIIICVPTPLNEYHEPDLSYITDTAHAVAPNLRAGQIVILESTTYPGTTEEVLIPILEKENKARLTVSRKGEAGDNNIWVAFSPEREDPGNTQVARHDIPKVIGGADTQASEIAAALYGSIFRRTVLVSSPAAAEMTKLLENIYRCVNIALVNELKMLLPAHGSQYLGDHRRRRDQALRLPSVLSWAWAGRTLHSCRSFYPRWKAKEFDFNTRFHRTGRRNQREPCPTT
jgi:UDP-N-acetyl-D-glucosamine dehydrogenase